MMWGFYDGWGWLAMATMMLLFWGGFVALVVFAIRAFTGGSGGHQAEDVLRRRLASGQITPEEYEKTRRLLHGS